ncbi:pirin family protein [Pseudobdellovibrio exovorus]|uniref:Pirin family protein n=1 Tax=Pseudobdellovibrio exovorus JSS TaxID=1184267 RepID=M4V953_9BACT|nr:pirin family protein [Pseudobdellovibrio exovorus]AGH94536.1 hypothetical protein A11Q_316 [Pseudobdellovibrio exovorus JSS]
MKKLVLKQRGDRPHWVGDGFPVRSIFTYNDLAHQISPFLLMDYAGPAEFPPAEDNHIRGVDSHPHRGFETVTVVYHGEVEHRDSSGGGGIIKPGDVQWMTAASGLVHEEKHGKEFSKKGGRFEMVQLWVNLPQKDKMSKPRYQGIKNEQIPVVTLHDADKSDVVAGTLRLIAGEFRNTSTTIGPAKTFTPINLWDIQVKAGSRVRLPVVEGRTATLFVLKGQIQTPSVDTTGASGPSAGVTTVNEAELAIFERSSTEVEFTVTQDSQLLFMGGEPIEEPIVGYGPFVMNTTAEIYQAFDDFNSGKMGEISNIEGTE